MRTSLRATRKLIRTEAVLYLREPIGAFFGIAFPAILIVVLGKAMPGFTQPSDDLGGQRPIDIYLPIALALAIATVSMVTLLNGLATYRERGVLRRLSTTPVAPSSLLAAQLVVNVAALLLGSVLAYATASVVFTVRPPTNVGGLALSFGLGSAAMCAVALLIAAVMPSTRASSALGSLVYFPMMFVAGVWTPGPTMPEAVRRVADFTPLGAASQAMQASWAGASPRVLHLAVMAAITAGCATAAARLFRWS
jgi:ABC-2 type transport system permease protein